MSHTSKRPRLKNSRYITGIDGLRALAVIGVIIYHLLPYDLKGGYMGVPIFFVISGYLITDLLMKEWRQTGKINVKSFYYRRIRRLYPALVTTVIGSGAYITLFQRNLLVHLRSVIWTNLLYVYNWWEILHGQNYFDRFQGESPFIHLWTLSIDGQYYLFWPLIMIVIVIMFRHRRKLLAGLFALLTLLGAWYMAYVYSNTGNINRVYYGTDTRMFSIFAGVALAYFWPADTLRSHVKLFERFFMDLVGIVSLVGIIYAAFIMGGQNPLTYKYGMLIVTVLATIFLATICHPGADMNRMMTNPVFHWLGTRSYGIYLYQFPVMIFYEARVHDQAVHPLLNSLIEVIIIGAISELSYRWIENPLRHYDYRRFGTDLRNFFRVHSWVGLLKRLIVLPILAVLLVCLTGAAQAPNHQKANPLQKNINKNQGALSKSNQRLMQDQHRQPVKVTRRALAKPLNKPEKQVQHEFKLTKYQVLAAKDFPMTAVGDSILVDSSKDLQQVFKNTYVKAKVGGQLNQAADALRTAKSSHRLQKNILVNIGTNAPLTSGQIRSILRIVGSHRNVYWITTHVPTKPYQNSVNRTIRRMAKEHHNMHVVDWYRLSHQHSSYFWGDHVHPNPTGNKAFVRLIVRTIFNK